MRKFLSFSAAVALVATGAIAQPGKNDGKGNGKENNPAAMMQNDGKPDRGENGKAAKNDKAHRGDPQAKHDRGDKSERTEKSVRKIDRRGDANGTPDRIENAGPARQANGKVKDRGNGNLDRIERRVEKYIDRGDGRAVLRDYDRNAGLLEGCPPGLAKKYNGCRPPGLAKKQAAYDPSWFGYRDYGNARFFYDDGALVRLGGDGMISALLPLLGGALNIGNLWPDYYEPVTLRPYYRRYFDLEPNGYRYANDAIYRVDPRTSAITSIVALLTGDDFVVGQPAPAGYGVYNVPLQYRDQYRDGPDGYYRYSDGYVYRLDPETRIVAAAIELALS
ncbi:MAG: hypothetical protein HKO05_07725 [Erythrobacter sp.]|nr:hypothetical protein [Erythrobacter sp.]